jgi:recombinational DNA repair ATPase RecF
MLNALSIRDIVLIERLDIALENGLTVLTGETGAGKSILLDALGLAMPVWSAMTLRGASSPPPSTRPLATRRSLSSTSRASRPIAKSCCGGCRAATA